MSRITTYHLNVNQPKKSVKREEGEDDEEVEFKQPSSEPDATTLQMIMNLMTQCARLRTLEITFSHRIPEELDAPNAPFSIKDYDRFGETLTCEKPSMLCVLCVVCCVMQ